jgi:hypothetical protein
MAGSFSKSFEERMFTFCKERGIILTRDNEDTGSDAEDFD